MTSDAKTDIRWLVRQMRPFWPPHLASLYCTALASLMTLLDPLILKWLIDDVLPQRSIGLVVVASVGLLLSTACRLGLFGLGSMLSFVAIQKMLFNIRLRTLRHLQRLPAEYHDNSPVGDTLFRLDRDVDLIGELGGDFLTSFTRTIFMGTLILIAMFVLNFRLALLIVPLLPLFIWLHWRYRAQLQQLSETTQQQAAKLVSFIQEHLLAILQIKLLSSELRESRRFVGLAKNTIETKSERLRKELIFTSFSWMIIALGLAIVMGFGGYQVIQGGLSIGGLFAFNSFVFRLFDPFSTAVSIYSRMYRVRASIQRIREIWETDAAIEDHPEAMPLAKDTPGVLELKDVSFGYRPGRLVLSGLNLKTSPGERIALVGSSGSGKSTVGKLITRLYDMEKGSILVDGIDIRNIKLTSLRSNVAFVPQDPFLFDVTLRENLLFGNPAATAVNLEEAIELAQLREVIDRLPKGLDEPLGPRGGKLSGGERQRVALARGILQNPRILILDECTSALDGPTEKKLLESLEKFVRGRTTIIISHRLSSMLWASRIAVMDQGIIIEEGTHNELYQSKGIYRRLCNEQMRDGERSLLPADTAKRTEVSF